MNIIESEKYQGIGKDAKETLSRFGHSLEYDQREHLEIAVRRSDVHKRLESVIGGNKIAVANDLGGKRIGGFVTLDDNKIHITEKVLDDPDLAVKVAQHENKHHEHVGEGLKEIDFKAKLDTSSHAALSEYMNGFGHDFGNINFLEGFTEACTARRCGKNEKCAYNQKEVPAAEVLDELCMKETGRSVISAFDRNDFALMYELVKSVAAILIIKKQFNLAA